MGEFYSEIRLVHITAALASGGLFFARGMVLFAGRPWAMAAPLRYLAYTIDTVLLTAALMLMTIVRQYPFIHHWLTMKIVLLIVYIVLGIVAFRKTRASLQARMISWVAALIVFAFIYAVARAHDPLGPFRG